MYIQSCYNAQIISSLENAQVYTKRFQCTGNKHLGTYTSIQRCLNVQVMSSLEHTQVYTKLFQCTGNKQLRA